jgi:hypothetical protein
MVCPVNAFAQDEDGIVLGRVYEIDKKKYQEEEAGADAEDEDEGNATTQSDARDGKQPDGRLEEYLEPRSNVEVIARLLASNQEFQSEQTGGDGDYLISNLSPGVFEFKLRFEDLDYPVAQRLDAKVNLTFLAELCFVLDKEEQVAWMVAAGPRRSPDVPTWVPEQCQSRLSACLGLITDEEDFRKGLLLIFAGSGAAATGIGIAATREDPASPLERRRP